MDNIPTMRDLNDAFNFVSKGNRDCYGAGCVAPGQSVPVNGDIFHINKPSRFAAAMGELKTKQEESKMGKTEVELLEEKLAYAKREQEACEKQRAKQVKFHAVFLNGNAVHVSPNEKGALKFAAKLIDARLDDNYDEKTFIVNVMPVTVQPEIFFNYTR